MPTYLNRAAAVTAARNAGGIAFMTHFDLKTGVWYVRGVDMAIPAEVVALEALPIVHHVEWALIEGGHLMPCAVVTCSMSEAIANGIPDNVRIEPLDADLWRVAGPSPVRPRSTVESPVKVVWRIAGEMIGAARKDVIAACVALGVDKSTASTQYYKFGIAQKTKA